MNEIYKRNLIMEYTSEEDCIHICDNKLFDCYNCNHIDKCYANVQIEYNDELNNGFAEAINFGGYENSKEFWNELLE